MEIEESNVTKVTAGEWERRREQLRQQAWELAQELLADTRQMVRQALLQKGAYFSLHQVARYIEAIAKLSAIALGDEEDDGMEGRNGFPIPLSIKAAVERIYGPKRSGNAEAPKASGAEAAGPGGRKETEVQHACGADGTAVR